jgi:hypothetical protein
MEDQEMASKRNTPALRIVEADNPPASLELLIVGDKPQRIRIEERDVPRARIDLALSDYFTVHGLDPADRGTILGSVSLLWRGQPRRIAGECVALLNGPDVVLPRGTFAALG